MYEPKHPATDQEHTSRALQPSRARSPLQRTMDPHHLARYHQLMGQRLPAGLRLSPSPLATAQPPVQHRAEEAIQQEPSPPGAQYGRVSGEGPAPMPQREARRAHLWENQIPPHLRLSPFPHAQQQPAQEPAEPLQRKENTTGLPDTLKAGVEHLSGISLDNVHVHPHSPHPAEVQALAYTQGTEIYIGPGQDQHLAHEAWHVVQQKQGRVTPTVQVRGETINDDEELEKEAEVMGARALQGMQAHPEARPSLEVSSPLLRKAARSTPAKPQEGKVLQRAIGHRARIGDRVRRGPQGDRKDFGTIAEKTIRHHKYSYTVIRHQDNRTTTIEEDDALYGVGNQGPGYRIERRRGGDNYLDIGEWRRWRDVHVSAHAGQRPGRRFHIVFEGPVRPQGFQNDSSGIIRILYNDRGRQIGTTAQIGGAIQGYNPDTVVEERLRHLGADTTPFSVNEERAQMDRYADTLASYALALDILS